MHQNDKDHLEEGSGLLAMIDSSAAVDTLIVSVEDGVESVDATGNSGNELVEKVTAAPTLFSADEGDIFINSNSVPTLVILAITTMANGDKNYRVRFPLVVDQPVIISEKEVVAFINLNGLKKLEMERDVMKDITSKILLSVNDVYMQNGQMIATILTDEFVYVDGDGKATNVVGCSINGNIGTYRDVFEVKAFLFDNADEFAALRNPQEGV